MLPIASENMFFELICFTAFISICAGLLKLRYSKKCSFLILAGSIAVAAGIQITILLTAPNAPELILTLLPITAYLPVIIAVHILAKGGFAAAVATWSLGLFAPYILNLFRELMRQIRIQYGMPLNRMGPVVLGSLILAALLVVAALWFCRKPFQTFDFQNKYIWLIVPVILLFLLISYFESMTFEPLIAFITFSLVLVMFVFFIRFLKVAMSERIAKASEQEIARQLDMQRQELLRINQKMEQGRIYRHDMRHHLSILNELAESEKTDEIQKYINSLNSRISTVEKEGYCENTAVNAVLSSYIGKAKQEDVRTAIKVNVPKELPIDVFDVCTVLANALDNAVAACRSSQGERWIDISSALHQNGNFSVDIKNLSETPVVFGKDGLPVSHGGEEHGFGIKSIDTIVRKYNGILRCTCDNGVFRLSAVLFPPNNVPPAARPIGLKKIVSNAVTSVLLAVCFLNFLPDTVQAVAAVPVIGDAIQLLDISTYRTYFSWGSSSLRTSLPQIAHNTETLSTTSDASEEREEIEGADIQNSLDTTLQGNPQISEPSIDMPSGDEENSITIPQIPTIAVTEQAADSTEMSLEPAVTEEPVPSGSEAPALENQNPPTDEQPNLSNGIDEMNRRMEEYIDKIEEEFLYYFSRKYRGYVASDTGYSLLRDDERLLSIQFYTTINMGGSGEYSRCFTLDKASGTVLEFSDLFAEGSDYIGVISADILRQMEKQMAAGEADYFLPGGIWSDEECFKEIDGDQNFYINENDQLVILFDEYEVAPGSAGMPQFTIEPDVLKTILRQPSVLSPAEKETE